MKLSKKFEKQSGNKAAQFVQCLNNMAMVVNDSLFYNYTKEWVESVDRGGLFLVNDSTFKFFKAVEVKLQLLLPQHLSQGGDKEALLAAIVSDHDVNFYWCILAVDIENEENALELLEVIVKFWVTIRGFALTSMWIEEYKRTAAKNTQKEKSLRMRLQKETEKTHN